VARQVVHNGNNQMASTVDIACALTVGARQSVRVIYHDKETDSRVVCHMGVHTAQELIESLKRVVRLSKEGSKLHGHENSLL
jgi:hypothetical protein